MPDPLRQTISATEVPALWNVSPWVTRWMLWHRFADGMDIDARADSRMEWGKLLQPLIIAKAAEDLHLEVRPNADDTYHRSGMFGCTRDADIICPSRGPGALETKCVFDYRTWMTDWAGGKRVPRHYEIQLQMQMRVGEHEPFRWGVIAAWVAGEMHYFEREPIPKFWNEASDAARAFFASVEAKQEPEPFGDPVEVPLLKELFPIEKGKQVDFGDDAKAAEVVRQFEGARQMESGGRRTAEVYRAKLLAMMRDAEEGTFADGIKVRMSKSTKQTRINVYIPDEAPAPQPYANLLIAG